MPFPTPSQLSFGTEHLYQRHDETWLNNCRVRHYLLPVHLSEAFLFTPTLASTCYLLLLRWIDRQFGDAFRLSDSCVSDKRLEPGVCHYHAALLVGIPAQVFDGSFFCLHASFTSTLAQSGLST